MGNSQPPWAHRDDSDHPENDGGDIVTSRECIDCEETYRDTAAFEAHLPMMCTGLRISFKDGWWPERGASWIVDGGGKQLVLGSNHVWRLDETSDHIWIGRSGDQPVLCIRGDGETVRIEGDELAALSEPFVTPRRFDRFRQLLNRLIHRGKGGGGV